MAELRFQNFDLNSANLVSSDSSDDDTFNYNQDSQQLLSSHRDENQSLPKHAFWSFEYYAQYFDVDTEIVVGRIWHSIIPKLNSNFIVTRVRPKPDLYGPIWIGVTLVFALALSGNLTNYMHAVASHTHTQWHYDFNIVTASASTIYAYMTLVPLILYIYLRYRTKQPYYSYLEILCMYAYSLAIFIPIALFWTIDISWLRWTLLLVGCTLTATNIALSIWPAFCTSSTPLIAFVITLFAIIMHFLLAIVFKVIFFEKESYVFVKGIETTAATDSITNTLMNTTL